MGILKLNDINYTGGGGSSGSSNTIECTQAQYNAWKQAGTLQHDTVYILTDAANLNGTADDLSYDGGSDSTKDVIDTLQKALSYTTILDESFTSSTTYSYTGKSVTCPIGHIYIVRARCSYSNSAPQEIGASNSSTASDFYRTYARTDKACEIIFVLTAGESAYIWTKYASAASNTIRISVIDIT